jgi:hypothetical protein
MNCGPGIEINKHEGLWVEKDEHEGLLVGNEIRNCGLKKMNKHGK